MTIKQQGGVFGRNPSFNDTETNDLVVNDKLGVGAGTPAANAKAHISRASSGASVLSGTTLALESTGDVILDMLSPATGRALIVFGNSTSNQRGDLLYDHNADTLRVRVGNTTQATFNTSGLAFPNGKGIDFSATSGTGTSELFDDYEEGTWTPVLSDGTNNATMSANSAGSYTKIGRLIVLNASVETTSLGSVTGAIRITGLPYSNLTGTPFYASGVAGYGELLNITAGQSVGLAINSGNAHINLNLWDAAGGISPMQASEWSADGVITFSISYFGA
jgi:hypothetical protein